MIKFSEIVNSIKILSGSYNLTSLDISSDNIKSILEVQVLKEFDDYRPATKKTNIQILTSPYIFVSDIPEWLVAVKPINMYTALTVVSNRYNKMLLGSNKPTLIWEYRKPKLFIEYSGDYEVEGAYNSALVEVEEEDTEVDYEITNIGESDRDLLVDLTLGYYMLAMGRGRSMAKFTDIPIEISSESFITDGKDLIEKTTAELRSRSKWYLALKV